MVEKKRKTWLWILGWVFCFPIPLTILMLRNKTLSAAVRYAIIGLAWATLLLFAVSGGCSRGQEKVADEPSTQEQTEPVQETPVEETPEPVRKRYELSGAELGEYGTSIVLNQNTDMPVEKRLYKLPAGKYRVTTTNEKVSAFYVVKDVVGLEEGNSDYPEILVYVGDGYLLTAGDNDLNGHALREVEVEVASDESILLPTEKDTIVVEEL